MKKITLLLSAFLCFSSTLWGQFEYKGSYQYGKTFDITYNPLQPNVLYSLSLANHIMYSVDAGQTWDIYYSFPQGMVEDLRYIPEQHALSFYVNNTQDYALYVLDIATKTIKHKYKLPVEPYASSEWIGDYDINADNPEAAIVMKFYRIGLTTYQKIYYTTDAGENWDMIYFIEDYEHIAITNVKIHPDNISKLYLSRALNGVSEVAGGIFVSEDGGQTFDLIFENIPMEIVEFNPENSNEIWVGSYIPGYDQNTIGLFKSMDGGETWQSVESEAISYIMTTGVFSSTDMDFHENSVDLYNSALGLGVVKYNLDFSTLTVGEPEIITQNKAIIYPNPTTGTFSIQAKEEVKAVEIYALTGQKLTSTTTQTIDASSLSKGIYIVKILMENGTVYTEKLIRK